jgi:exosortase
MEGLSKVDEPTAIAECPASTVAGRWVPFVQAALLAVAGGYLFAPAAGRLASIWWSSELYSYGALIPLVSAYIAWTKRAELRTIAASPSPWAIPAVLATVAAFGFGRLGDFVSLQTLGTVMYVSTVVLAVWGSAIWRTLAFPLGFLMFIVPIPAALLDRIALPLQLFAATFAGWVLDALNIPVLLDGVYIHLPRTVLQVAVACAGLRFLVTITTIGVLVAYWGQRTLGRRLLVVGLAMPIAILANAARVAVAGILAHVVGPEAAHGFFHSSSGTIVFWLGIAGLLGMSAVIRQVGR